MQYYSQPPQFLMPMTLSLVVHRRKIKILYQVLEKRPQILNKEQVQRKLAHHNGIVSQDKQKSKLFGIIQPGP